MKKYSEDREENQWDDDFIFDAAPVTTKKKSTAGPSHITSHLSVTSAAASKDKRKSSTASWSNAFKKMGPDPRQIKTTTSTRTKESSSHSHSATTTTSTSSSRPAPPPMSGNEEFAFFDSEDTVGFGRHAASTAAGSAMKTKLQSGENLIGSSNHNTNNHISNSQQSQSVASTGDFDDGLGFNDGLDGNLGFDDEDFIPNVGFDDDEEEEEGGKLNAQPVSHKSNIEHSPPSSHHTLSLSSRSGHSGYSGQSGYSGFSEVQSNRSSATTSPRSLQSLQSQPQPPQQSLQHTQPLQSLQPLPLSVAPPSLLRRGSSGSGSVASVVAMINAKAGVSTQPDLLSKKTSPVRTGNSSSANSVNNHNNNSFNSVSNTPRTPHAPVPDYFERQLEDHLESDQPLSFDVLETLHSSSQHHIHSSGAGGTSIASYSFDKNRNPRLSPGIHVGSQHHNSSYYNGGDVLVPRATRPPSQASSSYRDSVNNSRERDNSHSSYSSKDHTHHPSPPTGSRLSSHTRSSGSNRSSSNSHHALNSGSRLSTHSTHSLHSARSAPLSVSDEDSSEDWNSQFGDNNTEAPGLAKLTLPSTKTGSNKFGSGNSFGGNNFGSSSFGFSEDNFAEDHEAVSEPGSPFGGVLRSTSDKFSDRGNSNKHNHSNPSSKERKYISNSTNNTNNTHNNSSGFEDFGDVDFMSEENGPDSPHEPYHTQYNTHSDTEGEDFIIRHSPQESLDEDGLLGLRGEFGDSGSDRSGSHSGFESRSGSETGSETESEEEEGDWDLDLELPRPGEAHLTSAQTYKEILTGKTPNGAQTDDSTSVTERESLLDYLKGSVQRTIFPPSLSHLSSPHDMHIDMTDPDLHSHDGQSGNPHHTNTNNNNITNNNINQSMDSNETDPHNNHNSTHPAHNNIPKSSSTPSLSSRSHNNVAYEEEGHNVETANPHLRGLLDWVDASTTSLHAVLSNTNSNKDYNARTLLQQEVDLPKDDPLFIDRLLERCEVLPSSDSCIRTLEVVSKWLRGVCNLHDSVLGALHSANSTINESASDCEARLSSNSTAGMRMRRTASLGETRASAGNAFGAGSMKVPHTPFTPHSTATVASPPAPRADPIFGDLSGSRLDKTYDWCDDILQEQLVSTTAALGAGYRKLLEINTRHIASQARAEASVARKTAPEAPGSKNHWLNMGMVAVREPASFNNNLPQPLSSVSRISTTPSDDDQLIVETFRLSSNLISLYRLQINMLEMRIHMYDSFELVACMELLQKISEELEKVTSTLFAALRRVLPAAEVSTTEQLAQRQQLESLTTVANDLLGCCFSIKVLAICAVSPINFQPLPEGCQRIISSANDLARMSSFDVSASASGGSSQDFNARSSAGSGMGSAHSARTTTTYNVIYELTLGTHFLDLMLLIPSPSVVRSKLCIAAYTYLQKLKKKELPWQSRDFKLVSIRQHLESFANMFNIYHGADAFGLNYSEMDNNTFTLSLAEVEGSIVQSFSEVFGTLDQHRIVQLLLFEGSNELLPTVARDFTGAASFLHKANPRPLPTGSGVPLYGAGVPDNCDSDISDPSSASKGQWGTFTTMKAVFRHTSAALNFDKSLQLVRKKWTPGLPPISGSTNADSTSTKNASTISTQVQADTHVVETPAPDLVDMAIAKSKGRTLSYSTRYELFHFCNQVLFRLAQSIVEMSPNVALDVYQMCILLLAHLRHNSDRARVEKVAAMLAVKVGRRDAAIWHGEAVLKNLQRKGDNINEMLYMTDLLAAQYSENAQYELAAKALFSAISVLNRRHKFAHMKRSSPEKGSKSSRRKGSIESASLFGTPVGAEPEANSTMDFERALDPLLLKLGRLLLQFGCPDRAADTFQVLLSSLCERTDCLANDAKKVTVLSWLAEAYLELEDFSSCAQVLGAIKSVRNVKLRKATAWAASGGGLDLTADVSDKSKSPSPSPVARGGPSSVAAAGKSFFKKNTSLLSRSLSRDIPADWRSRRSGSIESMSDAAQMSRSFDKSAELERFARPPSRGIANTGSADSFDLDGPSRKYSDARPLPATPSAGTVVHMSEGGVLRSRPLPPTPKVGVKSSSQDAHAAMGRRALPQTPVEKSVSRDSTGSSTGGIVPTLPVSAMSTGNPTGRKRPNLRIEVSPRPMSSSSIAEDIKLEKGGSGSPRKDRTPRLSTGGVHAPPLSARSSSVRITPGTKRRKNRAIQNLQPLQLSNSSGNLQDVGSLVSPSGDTSQTPTNLLSPGSPRSGLTPVGGSPVLSPGGNLAVNSMYLHYLRNSPEANLPQYCVTTEDLDLGQLKARLHFKNKHYVLALKCLLPTLMGVELTVIGADRAITPNSGNVKHNWSRQSLMELGELYYLRGKIQLEAAKSSSEVSYPFQVGSKHLFQKVQDVLWVEERHGQLSSSVRLTRSTKNRPAPSTRQQQQQASAQPRRFARTSMRKSVKASKSSKPITMPGRVERNLTVPTLAFTCREPSKYTCAADLCWDAMMWFGRAREVAKLAGDEVGGALAANSLAMCHLLPTFVPTALFGVPLERSKDLSPPSAQAKEAAAPLKRDSLSRNNRLSLSRVIRPTRCASMAEVQMSMEAALEVNTHSCLPLPLIDSYLNLAEMCELIGNKSDAVAFWNETKGLFLHLFADGALLPLVRRASLRFVRKIAAVLNRIVRFMWTLDQSTANNNLFLLDLQIVLSHEIERAYRKCTVKSNAVSEWLPDVLERLLPSVAGNDATLSSKPEDDKARKRTSKSRFSRFFSRIFTGSMKSKSTSEETRDSLRSDETSGRNVEASELSERTRDGKKPQIGSSRSQRGAKANTTFDSFIQRFGFDANLDVRRFYNLMNADLVMEKVHDFGWSKCVEHDQLLKPVGVTVPDTTSRPFSISSVHSGTSSLTAQVNYSATGLELVGANLTTNIDVLVILNLRAKLDYQEKYRSLATARFVKDHVLRRGDLVVPEPGEEDDLEGELADPSGSADHINASRDEESSVEGGAMHHHNSHNHSSMHLLVKSSLSPRSGASSKMGSFSGKQGMSMSPAPTSHGSNGNTSRVMDPLMDIPVDPFADFDWMDESFADYSPHSQSLQARTLLERQQSTTHSRSRNKYKRFILGDDVAQFPALFMPEFDEAHFFSTEEVKSTSSKHDHLHLSTTVTNGSIATTQNNHYATPGSTGAVDGDSAWGASTAVNREYLRTLDERAETVLIQRAWRCHLLLQNAQWGYRSGKRSLGVLRSDARSALSCMSLNMVRLRAFSRQYQHSLLEFERLVPEVAALPAVVGHHGVSKPIEESTRKLEIELMRNRNGPTAAENVRTLRVLMKESKLRQPVLLQHRLPFFVYAIHFDDNLLLYRPHDGTRNVQKLGGAGFITYAKERDTAVDDSRAAQVALMNTSFTSAVSFASESSAKGSVKGPASPPHPRSLNQSSHASPPMGIAQVEKKPNRLEPKLSIMSLLSMMSGSESNSNIGGTDDGTHAQIPSKAPLDTSHTRSFFSGLSHNDHELYAISSSEGASSHDSSWGQMPTLPSEKTLPRKSLARAELEGSSLGSHSTIEAAVLAGKPIFSARESSLLYDLAVSTMDAGCAGGKDVRKAIFADLKGATGVLHSSVQFLQTIAESIKAQQQQQLQLQQQQQLQHAQPVSAPFPSPQKHATYNTTAEGAHPHHAPHSGTAHSSAQNSSTAGHETSSGKSGFISEASESLNTLSIHSHGSEASHTLPMMRRHSEHRNDFFAEREQHGNRYAPHREDSASTASSFVALSASMSNILGLFASSDSAEAARRRNKGDNQGFLDEDDEESTRPPHKLVPLTVVCSHSAAALPWEALLLKAQHGAPVVRSLTLLSLCAQAYSSTWCTILPDSFAKAANAPATELALARGVLGPQWQQKAAYVAVAYESRDLPPGVVHDLRTGQEERRRRTARHSLTALLQPHTHAGVERAASRREYFPSLQSGVQSPSSRSKHSHFRSVLSSFENGTLPTASPLFSTDRTSLSFFGKGDMIVAGIDCLNTHNHQHSDAVPNARTFWRLLPPLAPLRRTLSQSALTPGCRVEAVPNSSFPLLILSYVDYLQVSDALSYLVSHRPDAVLVFAPLFIIEPLAIEIKLSLDRWCKPESLPTPAASPEKTATLTTANSGSFGGGGGAGARSANSSRFLFSSFLGFGSAGEASASTFNFNESNGHHVSTSSNAGHDHSGMMQLPPSVTSMSSGNSGNGSSATTLQGLSGKHRPLPKIVEESHEFSRSESSSAQDSANQRHLTVTRSHSSDVALDALFDFSPAANSPHTPNTPNTVNTTNNNTTHPTNSYRNSKSVGNILDRVRSHTPSHISSSTSSGASSSRRSGKSLRAKERTWVYHAVMSVVQDMQAEHEVPIVVFI